MNSNTSTQPKRKHLLDIIAERLGCACLSDLRMPQYRERALKELQEGDFDHLEVNEYKDAVHYLAPPLKTMLYGTTEDKNCLRAGRAEINISLSSLSITAMIHSYQRCAAINMKLPSAWWTAIRDLKRSRPPMRIDRIPQ